MLLLYDEEGDNDKKNIKMEENIATISYYTTKFNYVVQFSVT